MSTVVSTSLRQRIVAAAVELTTAHGWAHVTMSRLAERVGVSRQTINYIEQGTYCPSTRLALQLAAALGVSVEDLFYLTNGDAR